MYNQCSIPMLLKNGFKLMREFSGRPGDRPTQGAWNLEKELVQFGYEVARVQVDYRDGRNGTSVYAKRA